MKRSRFTVRKVSKKATVDGASERELRDEMDELVRKIIELRDHRCFTCQVPRAHYKTIFPGHFISRKILALRWNIVNTHAQCNVCNDVHNTKPDIYRRFLVREYDESTVLQLEFIAQQNPELDYMELLRIRDGLRAELTAMKAERS